MLKINLQFLFILFSSFHYFQMNKFFLLSHDNIKRNYNLKTLYSSISITAKKI